MAKALLVDVMENKVEEVDVESLEDYYRLIHCDTVEIVSRLIGDKRFDIIADEEGLLVNDPLISAINSAGKAMLVGNLIVCGEPDGDGEMTPLTDEDIRFIQSHIQQMGTILHPEGHCMICDLDW